MCKIALFSRALWSRFSGQGIMLERLLSSIDPAKYLLLSTIDYNKPGGAFPAKFYYISPSLSTSAQGKIAAMSKRILQIIEEEHCTAIVACTSDLFGLPACHLASCLADIPFYLYMFDDYAKQWCDPSQRQIAETYLPRMAQDAQAVIVPNELLQDVCRQRLSIEPIVIHNPPMSLRNNAIKKPARGGDELNIVYTGMIYDAHYDAFYNLITAAKAIRNLKVSIHLYTLQGQSWLQKHGLVGPIVYHPYLSGAELARVYYDADLLFLPLAFNSPYPEGLIKTSSPGKMGDYLNSGRPILVHGPPDSFMVQYFKKHHCGLVVDVDDPIALAGGLLAPQDAPELWRDILQNAKECAKRDFDPAVIQAQFADLFFKENGGAI